MNIQEIIDEFREKFDDGIDPAEWYCDWKDEDIDEWLKKSLTAYGKQEFKAGAASAGTYINFDDYSSGVSDYKKKEMTWMVRIIGESTPEKWQEIKNVAEENLIKKTNA